MEMLKEVLKDVKPSAEEEKEVNRKVNEFLNKINKGLKGAKAVLGGSGAKGTWLSGAYDVDVFVRFDYKGFKDKSEQLSDILEKHLKKMFKIDRLHGSRDYFQIKQGKFSFEVIPVLKTSKAKEAMNITDVSILHAEWVKRHKRFADDIRICKQFCKANNVYGAESYIRGFSGYECEILVIYYGGFMNLVRNAAKWGEKEVIDASKFYRNKNEVLMELNKSKLIGPLVLVDPVDKNRNAAAALSNENYFKFIRACGEFLKKPGREFFAVKEVSEEEPKKMAGKELLLLIDVKAVAGKEDVVGGKLLKVFEFIRNKLIGEGFKVYESSWKWGKKKYALFWFVIDRKELPEFEMRNGPPVKIKMYAERFRKQYGDVFVKNKRLFAKVKREFRKPAELLKKLIKDEYLRDKVKEMKFKVV